MKLQNTAPCKSGTVASGMLLQESWNSGAICFIELMRLRTQLVSYVSIGIGLKSEKYSLSMECLIAFFGNVIPMHQRATRPHKVQKAIFCMSLLLSATLWIFIFEVLLNFYCTMKFIGWISRSSLHRSNSTGLPRFQYT